MTHNPRLRKPGCIYQHPHDHECRNQDDMRLRPDEITQDDHRWHVVMRVTRRDCMECWPDDNI